MVCRPIRPDKLRVATPFVQGQNSRDVIRSAMPGGARVSYYNKEERCNYVARSQFENVVEGLRQRFGRVFVMLEFADVEKCTEACHAAKPETWWTCACVCGGLHHGGGGTGRAAGWKPVGDHLLVSSQRFWREFEVR